MIRNLVVELRTPLPEDWEPQPSLSARHALTFLFAPLGEQSGQTPYSGSEYSAVSSALQKRRAWQYRFNNVRRLGLLVRIEAPSTFIHNSDFSSFGKSSPSLQRHYHCYRDQMDVAVAALKYGPAQIKPRHSMVVVKCEGCRKDERIRDLQSRDSLWICPCEERFEAVLNVLLEKETTADT